MKKFITVLIMILCMLSPALLPPPAEASPYYWSPFTDKDGLIYNSIVSLTIDPGGYLWIGTGDAAVPEKGGLSVLDRMGQCVSYTTAQGLGSNYIQGIAFEKVPEAQLDAADQGAIWIATRKGLSVLTRRGEWLPVLPGNSMLPGEDTTAVFIDRENTKWIAIRGSGVCSIDSKSNWGKYSAAQGLFSNNILCITQDSSGSIWLGSQDSGASYLDPKGAWVTFSSENSGLIGNCVRQVMEEKPGTLWFVTASGVSVFDGRNWTSYTAKNSPVAGFIPASMVIDRAGNKWIGTENGGLFKLDALSGWTRFTRENSGLIDNKITALALDQGGTLWIGTPSGLCSASALPERSPAITATGKQQQRTPLGLGKGRYCPFQDAMVWSLLEQTSSPVSLSFSLPALFDPGKLWFYAAFWADGNFKVQDSRYHISGTRQGSLSAAVQGTFSRAQILIAGAMLLNTGDIALDKNRVYPFPQQAAEDLAVYLQPGKNIPCDDPEVRALADSILPAESRTDMYRAARAIVYSHAVQDIALDTTRDTASGVETLQVLKEKKGGRQEKARVLCALARAAGIPARIALGSGAAVWAQLFIEGAGWISVEPSYPLYDYVRPSRTFMPKSFSSADAAALAISGADDDVQRFSWEPQVRASCKNAAPEQLPPLASANLLLLKINGEERVPDDAKVNLGKNIFVLAAEEQGETLLLFHDRAGRTIKSVPLAFNGLACTVKIAGQLPWRFIPRRIGRILALENLEYQADSSAPSPAPLPAQP